MEDGMNEGEVVRQIKHLLEGSLPPGHVFKIGMNLYYEVIVDNRLKARTDVRDPKRGYSAFQTDLCLVESVVEDGNLLEIPRVVFEFKLDMSTHDVLTYSAKARKHKSVYPYLRYGIVSAKDRSVPRKFFIHNEALDFCVALGTHIRDDERIKEVMRPLITAELGASHQLEEAAFGAAGPNLFRNEPVLGNV